MKKSTIETLLRPLTVSALAVGLLAALAQPADAGTRGWTEGSGGAQATFTDLVPSMSSDEAYTERYSFAVDLEGGGHVGVDLTISNLGWGDHNGAAAVRVKMPGESKYSQSKKVDRDDWSYSKKEFDLNIGDTRVRQKGSRDFELTHRGDGVRFDLVFENTTPMWRPGTGQIRTDAGYYKYTLVAPRANVTGTVTIGGKTHKVVSKGEGYGDHVATNVAPFDFAKRFSRFRTYEGDVFVMWREIELTEDLGGESFTWVVVGYKDKIVFSDADADIRFGRVKKDPKTGYSFPMAVQIDGKTGKDHIKLILQGKSFERTDLLESYGTAAKVVASTVSEPYRYDVKARFVLQMHIGGAAAQVNGNSHYVLDYVNK